MKTFRPLFIFLIITIFSVIQMGLILLTHPQSAAASSTPTHSNPLVETITNLDVSITLNDKNVCTLPVYGAYQPGYNRIVLCTTTSEDLEHLSDSDRVVLRHESTHLLQDCLSGSRRDNQLAPLTGTYEDLLVYIYGKLSPEDVNNISETYREVGADDRTIWLELEAFATQNTISDDAMSYELQRVCRNI